MKTLRVLFIVLCWLGLAQAAQAAISFVAASGNATGSSGSGSLTFNVPAGTAANDVMLAMVSVNLNGSSVTITAPSGWTLIRSDNSGSLIRQSLYYRVASASEPASYTWTFSGSRRAAGGILSYRGVDTTAPIDNSQGEANGASLTIGTEPLVTVAYNAMVVGFFGTANGNTSLGSYTIGMTERFDQATGSGPNGSTASAADSVQTTPGSTGVIVAIATVTAVNIGQLVSLKPSATLAADYHFDECSYSGTGSEVIDSTGSYNAQAKNSLNTDSPGQINRFGDFSIYSKWAQTSIPITGDWGLSAWFKMPIVSTQRYHVIGSISGGGDLLFLDKNNNYRWGVYTTSGTVNGTFRFGTLSNGWHHVALVGYNNRTYLYVDGAYVENVNRKVRGTLTYLGTSYDFVNTSNAQGFGAPLDEMQVYQNALSASQVSTIYTNQLAGLNSDGTGRGGVSCGGAVPGWFNAYEISTAAGAITGVIKTKVAGTSFSLDVAAINTARTAIETGFVGDVKVELLDASDNSGAFDSVTACRSSWTTIQTLATNPTFAAADNGRKTVTGFLENNAWRDVRVRVSYPATGTPTVIGCSTDDFAIRPASLGNTGASDATSTTAGTARALGNTSDTGGNVHRAGRPFTLSATARNSLGDTTTNYDGSPAANLTACLLPAASCTLGTLSPGTWSQSLGVVTSNTASYTEVGAFSMQLVDSTYASVDASDGSTSAERNVVSAEFNVGRFVPDYFEGAANNTPQFLTFNDAACASRSFTYIGQPFGYQTPPQALFTARNASGATTSNYRGALWKVTAAEVSQAYGYTLTPASTPGLTAAIGTASVTSNDDGTGTVSPNSGDTLTFNRSTTMPLAPFTAAIDLSLSVSDGSEAAVIGNGTVTTTTPATFTNIAFDAGNEFRYGRFKLNSAHGSELLALPMALEAQYWNGTFFATNTADNCTALTANNFSLGNYQRNLSAGETTLSVGALAAGRATLRLSRPGAGNNGSVDVALNLGTTTSDNACLTWTPPAPTSTGANLAWLRGKWCGANYDRDPSARATFGVYKNANEFIYLREVY